MITVADVKKIRTDADIVLIPGMRSIKYIVYHCTAGPQSQSLQSILNHWENVNKWKSPGYHFEIEVDGSILQLWPINKIANGVAGYNSNAIHVSYKGGIDDKGNPIDNRTILQKGAQVVLAKRFKTLFPNAVILGHRDFSTDQNGNGIIDRWEWIKSCPCFDVRDWLEDIKLAKIVEPANIVYKLNYPLIKNAKVREIQNALIKAGFKLTADGIFGAETDVAVRLFQRNKNLTVDGIVGNGTAGKLGIKLK